MGLLFLDPPSPPKTKHKVKPWFEGAVFLFVFVRILYVITQH